MYIIVSFILPYFSLKTKYFHKFIPPVLLIGIHFYKKSDTTNIYLYRITSNFYLGFYHIILY